MDGHFKLICKECQTVISQCRCPAPDKEIRYSICDTCKAQLLHDGSQIVTGRDNLLPEIGKALGLEHLTCFELSCKGKHHPVIVTASFYPTVDQIKKLIPITKKYKLVEITEEDSQGKK